MKKLFWITFLIVTFCILNQTVKANNDYSYLLKTPEENSILMIDVSLKSTELLDIFENNDKVTLISLTPSDPLVNKSFRASGYTVKEQFSYALIKYTDYLIEKGYGELAMKYKVNGYNVSKIKVFGKNKDLYDFVNKLKTT